MIETFTFLAIGAYFGIIEAILFHLVDWNRLKEFNGRRDIHQVFSFVRVLAYFTIWGIDGESLMFVIPCILMFPFIHDGVYYQVRYFYNSGIYKKGFFSDPSKTGTAITSMSFKNRLISFLLGLGACIIIENYWRL
jgi:hypothetical protein